MFKAGILRKVIIFAFLAFCTCIDPYYQKITQYESLLVVDGLITDEESPCTIKLSRTIQDQFGTPPFVEDATVFVTDNEGGTNYFTSVGNGVYKSDSTLFRGEVGKQYVLHISTSDGEIYVSDPCLMKEVPEIDSLYFEKDQELVDNGSVKQDGIRIFLDSKEGESSTYYRWEYEETWKFRVPDPPKAKYISEFDIIPSTDYNEYCWKSGKSYEILIYAGYSSGPETVKHQPVLFIDPSQSDRLLIQYSLLIKQYSLSETEFDFWNNLSHVSESGNDIFAAQPYTVKSNIHNINNPDQPVLGYFQVSSVRKKRMEIPVSKIAELELPFYHYSCERVETSPTDPIWIVHIPPLTFDQLYVRYTDFGYIFVEPRYIPGTRQLDVIIFSKKPECTDCELTGTSQKPDFWTDIN